MCVFVFLFCVVEWEGGSVVMIIRIMMFCMIVVNIWVWMFLFIDEIFELFVCMVVCFGYDVLELFLESIGDWDLVWMCFVLDGFGLGVVVVGVMGFGCLLLVCVGDVMVM